MAIEIAASDDAGIQRILREAYERGEVRGPALHRARRLIEERRARGQALCGSGGRKAAASAHDLVRTLRRDMQKRQLLVKKSNLCEQQLRFVLSALKDLLADENFVTLLRAEKVDEVPKHLKEAMKK